MGKTKLITLDGNTKEFMANGTLYRIETTISERRWIAYQKLQVEIGFNVQFHEFFQQLRQAYDKLNQQKFADAAVIIYNLMSGVKQVGENDTPTIIAMCALFINAEDEDRTIITDEMVEKKRTDWQIEGIDMNSFFQLAVHSIPDFISVYKVLSQDTLKQ
jgi:hypothetical protein